MTNAVTFKKPISILNKDMKLNYSTILANIGKSVTSFAGHYMDSGGSISGAVSHLIGSIAGLGFKDRSKEELAWLLVSRSMIAAMTELIFIHQDTYKSLDSRAKTKAAYNNTVLSVLQDDEQYLSVEFFYNPRDSDITKSFASALKEWLIDHGVEEGVARRIITDFPRRVVASLQNEWLENGDKYAQLDYLNKSPFFSADKLEQEWQRYNMYLEDAVQYPFFDEQVGLRNLYVPLRAYYTLRFCIEDQKPRHMRGECDEFRVQHGIVDMREHVLLWLQNSKDYNTIKIISGGPGSGKTSFLRMLAADLANNKTDRSGLDGFRVVYIALQHFDLSDAFKDALKAHLSYDFSEDILEGPSGPERLLLIFDGLDELSRAGEYGHELAAHFLIKLFAFLSESNKPHIRFQALVAGRSILMDKIKSAMPERCINLNVLPYCIDQDDLPFVPKASFFRSRVVDESNAALSSERFNIYSSLIDHDVEDSSLLGRDDRITWWEQYHKATGKNVDDYANLLNIEKLKRITSQPMLCHLSALSFQRGRVRFGECTSINELYHDLIIEVYARDKRYKKNRLLLDSVLNKEEFLELLEDIAVAAWTSEGDIRAVKIKDVESCLSDDRFSAFKDKSSPALRLLLAFFFRFSRQTGAPDVVEFTHKTFSEYLVARAVLRLAQEILDDIQPGRKKKGGLQEHHLKKWVEFCGPAALSFEILAFLRDEVKLILKDTKRKYIEELMDLFREMVAWILHHSLPMETLSSLTFQEQMKQARNAEETLLACLNACSLAIHQNFININIDAKPIKSKASLVHINLPDKYAFGNWLTRLVGQTNDGKTSRERDRVILDCCSFLGLSKYMAQILVFRDFAGIQFSYCDLSSCSLENINLKSANLEYANLENANLENANLEGANLKGTNLKGANLKGACLKGANLKAADLKRANLFDANLKDVNLEDANMVETKLRCTNLEYANLKGVSLMRANLEGANLRRACLENANLIFANLKSVNLFGANLKYSNFDGSNLFGANLKSAILKDTNLNNTKLSHALQD